MYFVRVPSCFAIFISHCGATQRHASAKYSMTRYTCLRLTSCTRKLGLLDTHPTVVAKNTIFFVILESVSDFTQDMGMKIHNIQWVVLY